MGNLSVMGVTTFSEVRNPAGTREKLHKNLEGSCLQMLEDDLSRKPELSERNILSFSPDINLLWVSEPGYKQIYSKLLFETIIQKVTLDECILKYKRTAYPSFGT